MIRPSSLRIIAGVGRISKSRSYRCPSSPGAPSVRGVTCWVGEAWRIRRRRWDWPARQTSISRRDPSPSEERTGTATVRATPSCRTDSSAASTIERRIAGNAVQRSTPRTSSAGRPVRRAAEGLQDVIFQPGAIDATPASRLLRRAWASMLNGGVRRTPHRSGPADRRSGDVPSPHRRKRATPLWRTRDTCRLFGGGGVEPVAAVPWTEVDTELAPRCEPDAEGQDATVVAPMVVEDDRKKEGPFPLPDHVLGHRRVEGEGELGLPLRDVTGPRWNARPDQVRTACGGGLLIGALHPGTRDITIEEDPPDLALPGELRPEWTEVDSGPHLLERIPQPDQGIGLAHEGMEERGLPSEVAAPLQHRTMPRDHDPGVELHETVEGRGELVGKGGRADQGDRRGDKIPGDQDPLFRQMHDDVAGRVAAAEIEELDRAAPLAQGETVREELGRRDRHVVRRRRGIAIGGAEVAR